MNVTCTAALSGMASNECTATDLPFDILRFACSKTLSQSRVQIRSNVGSQTLLILFRYYATAAVLRVWVCLYPKSHRATVAFTLYMIPLASLA